MNKLFNFILFAFVTIFITACGNDPSLDVTGVDDDEYKVDNSKNVENDGINVNGDGNVINNNYYDASTKSMTIKSDTLLIRDTTVIHDTIIKKEQITKRDTIISRDTVTLNNTVIVSKSDTIQITKTIHDTVKSVVTDTVVNERIDTVYKELVDTVYKKIIDTVFAENIIKPKDTSITFYDTTDGIIISKIYKGVVYKDVFYEAHEYPYGMNALYEYYGNYTVFYIPDSYVTVPDYAYGSDGKVSGYVHLSYQCGEISKPDYNDRAYKNDEQIKKFDGWRLFNEVDAYDMAPYLNMIVSDTAQIFLSVISYNTKNSDIYRDFTANIAKYKVPSMVSRNEDKHKIKYICAYDLK